MRARWRISASLVPAILPCAFSCLLAAAELSPIVPPARQTDPAVQVWLDRRMETWKARLQLHGWSVSIRVCASDELRPNTLGNIHWDLEKKTALIRVLESTQTAMERTVVHELVHLELAALPKTDATKRDEEQAVSRIADAMVAMNSETSPQ